MPWLDDSPPASPGAKQWQDTFKNAFLKRIQRDRIEGVLHENTSRRKASPDEIAHVLMGFRGRGVGTDDPLLFTYAQSLLRLGLIYPHDLLLALLDTSRFSKRAAANHNDKLQTGLPMCEERMFNMLCQSYMLGDLKCSLINARGLFYALSRWMHAVTEYEMGKQLEGGALHSADNFSYSTYEAIASLVVTIYSSPALRNVARQTWWKERRGIVVNEMENFDTHVLQWMQSQLAGRLRGLTNFPPFLETDAEGRPVFSEEQILAQIPAIPVVNSRAGLFIWLNACLCARPLTDDLAMLAFLQNRFSGNNQPLTVDLLVASFDVLSKALIQKESEQDILVIRSFICNKMPHLLGMVSAFMPPGRTVDTCIQLAFMSITMDALPPISAGATEVREKLKLTRVEFLQACALHALVSESIVGDIVQEPPISLPKHQKYSKEGLLVQVTSNVGRLEPLVDELESMDGNAGAIAGCIVDAINNFCVNKDTISLKTVCNMLIRKTPELDIILQYTQPSNLLLPLCTQLNDWIHDQDQTEFTPAYEEFASILLLILAVVHRYGLTQADIGLSNGDTFITRLLQELSVSKVPGELTDEQRGQLGKWIDGLYATDEHGESSGISDEVMRQCPPQAFYQLVPTLFEQSVLACKSGALTMKTFKGGLELLVEPFLLPSLVGGLSWLIQHSWEDHGDADVLLQVLEKLLKPSSSSQETKAMHRAILAIVAKPLYHSLKTFVQKHGEKKEVKGLMDILKPHLNQQRTVEVDKKDLEEWTSTTEGGGAKRIRLAIREQISWVSNVGPTPPPKYTHRIFAIGCEALGAYAMLDAIIAELKEQTNVGNGPLALDICTAMITAPLVTSTTSLTTLGTQVSQMQNGSPTVRDVLRFSTANVQKLLQLPTADAEALVRLNRRVEAQLAITHIPQIAIPMPMPDAAADQMMADLGLTDENLAINGADASVDQVAGLGNTSGGEFTNADLDAALGQTMDLANTAAQNLPNISADPNAMSVDQSQNIFRDLNLDLTKSATNADGTNIAMGASDGQQNPDDDIFAGLDMGDFGDDFNFS